MNSYQRRKARRRFMVINTDKIPKDIAQWANTFSGVIIAGSDDSEIKRGYIDGDLKVSLLHQPWNVKGK